MIEELKRAINTGQSLEVWYFGGSTPGRVRKISPIKIIENQVRAQCIDSNTIKSYAIEKMELYVPGIKPKLINILGTPPELNSISEMIMHSKDTLESLGWVIGLSEAEISLHQKFKNGKPKKAATVKITFEEFDYALPEAGEKSLEIDWNDFIPEIVTIDDLDSLEKIPRKKPWAVRAKSKNTTCYSSASKAFKQFLDVANELAEE